MRIGGNRAGTTVDRGREAERLAADYLGSRGLRIIERNFHCRGGEIDLIAETGDELVFVEVRYRTRAGYGSAADSVTATKQRRIILAARHYLAHHPERASQAARFDVLAIDGAEPLRFNWIVAAFTAF
ncbi:MAG: YraN family protein [Chromatiales bacterium]|nr:YraN family protein [Chromatiales bacterium]